MYNYEYLFISKMESSEIRTLRVVQKVYMCYAYRSFSLPTSKLSLLQISYISHINIRLEDYELWITNIIRGK